MKKGGAKGLALIGFLVGALIFGAVAWTYGKEGELTARNVFAAAALFMAAGAAYIMAKSPRGS